MAKRLRKLTSFIFSIVLVFYFAGMSALQANAAGTQDAASSGTDCPITAVCGTAPHIDPKVVNEHAGEKILFDNTHGQTAGAADWVINGGFSDFANGLAKDGYEIQELRQTTPITYDDLKDYDVFVIPEANIPFKQSEQDAMLEYVNNGGSIFFIGDHYNSDRNKNRWDASEVFNGYRRGAYNNPAKGMSTEEANSEEMQGVTSSDWLANNFGVRFRYNAIGDVNATTIVDPEDSFGITEGVDTVAMHAGATLAIIDPNQAKGIVYLPALDEGDAWSHAVDQGVYDGGGTAEGPMVAISKLGKGKAAFIGDSSPIEDASPIYLREDTGEPKTTYNGFEEQDDGALLINLMEWLSNQEDYTSFADTGIPLDQPTTLHDFEIPATSTEPEDEPWGPPEPGYEWWNPDTFAPGSYGSGELAVNPTYGFVHQDQLPAGGKTFEIRITGDKLSPFKTISDLRVGLYLPGGQQIGKFSFDGEHWPSYYGYSDYFSMNANSDGHASIDLYVRIKAGVTGEANLRLKQGSDKVITESVTIADVPVEQLPSDNSGETPDAISIDAARGQVDGTTATVHGTIVSEPGLYGAQGFYVQDDSGGIYVYQSQPGLHAGDEVTVTGTLSTFNTERELEDPTIVKTGSTVLPDPKVVDGLTDDNQGELVELKNVTISDLHAAGSSGTFEFHAVSDSGTTLVRVDSRTGTTIDNFPFQNGDTIDLIGVSSIFKGTYQLKPRKLSDFYGGVLPIAKVRELGPNQKVTFEGTATTRSGLWGAEGFYIQDDTGGVYIFQYDTNVQPGDKLKITGTTSIYNGELEISPTQIEKVGEATVPEPVRVTPDQVNESNQGQLVKLMHVKIQDVHQADGYGTTEFTAVKNGESVVVRLDNRTGTKYDAFPFRDGDILNIVGIASQFNGTFQVKPRKLGDLVLADVTAPTTTISVVGDTLSNGSFIGKAVVSLSAEDTGSGVAKVEYRLGEDAEWQIYQEPFSLSADGKTIVEYRSVDREGNVESVHSEPISIMAATYKNLYSWVDQANIHPNGLKQAVKAHIRSAERASNVKKEQQKLEKAWAFVENLPSKHIDATSKADLKVFFNYMIDHLDNSSITNQQTTSASRAM